MPKRKNDDEDPSINPPIFLSHLKRFPPNFLKNKLDTNFNNLKWKNISPTEWLCCFNTIFEKFELQEHDDSNQNRFEYRISFMEFQDEKREFSGASLKSLDIAKDIAASNTIKYLKAKTYIPEEIPEPPNLEQQNFDEFNNFEIQIEEEDLPNWQYNFLTSKDIYKKENQLRKIIWPVDDIKNWINVFHTQFQKYGLKIKFNHEKDDSNMITGWISKRVANHSSFLPICDMFRYPPRIIMDCYWKKPKSYKFFMTDTCRLIV